MTVKKNSPGRLPASQVSVTPRPLRWYHQAAAWLQVFTLLAMTLQPTSLSRAGYWADTDGDGFEDTYVEDEWDWDSDWDGYSDGDEIFTYFTDPYDGSSYPGSGPPMSGGDADGDGIPYDVEMQYGLDDGDASDALADLDGDGFSNLYAYQRGWPLNEALVDPVDTDGDGLNDVIENHWRDSETHPNVLDPAWFDDAVQDYDGDGVLNIEEIQLGLSPVADYSLGLASDWEMAQTLTGQTWLPPAPWLGDVDGDGLPDGWEHGHGFDFRNPNTAAQDPDQDGLDNLEEYQHGTHPWIGDSDWDGESDGSEVAGNSDPLDAQSFSPAWSYLDSDGDGYSNASESGAGSDPYDAMSTPEGAGYDPGEGGITYPPPVPGEPVQVMYRWMAAAEGNPPFSDTHEIFITTAMRSWANYEFAGMGTGCVFTNEGGDGSPAHLFTDWTSVEGVWDDLDFTTVSPWHGFAASATRLPVLEGNERVEIRVVAHETLTQAWRQTYLRVRQEGATTTVLGVEELSLPAGTPAGTALHLLLNPAAEPGKMVTERLVPVEIRSEDAENDGRYDIAKHDDIYPRSGFVSAQNKAKSFENALMLNFVDCAERDETVARPLTNFQLRAGNGSLLYIQGLNWEALEKPPGSPDLIPSNDYDRLMKMVSNHEGKLRGGLYRYKLNGTNIEVQVWLPLARPDIGKYWDDEVKYFRDTWGPAYRSKLARIMKPFTDNGMVGQATWVQLETAVKDMTKLGTTLDWQGDVKGVYSPCGGRGTVEDGFRYTVHGVVITNWMLNNMMYALIGREMTIKRTTLILGGDAGINFLATGAPDDEFTWWAYRMGFELFEGKSVKEVMESHGRNTQRPGEWSRREWPSWEKSESKLTRAQAQLLQQLIQ